MPYTYTAIVTTDTDANSPVKQHLVRKCHDNPLAIVEGDGSAPNFSAAALNSTEQISGRIFRTNSIDNAKVASATIGNSKLVSGPGATGACGQGEIKSANATFVAGGYSQHRYNPASTWGYVFTFGAAATEYITGWRSYTDNAAQQYILKAGVFPQSRLVFDPAGGSTFYESYVNGLYIGTSYATPAVYYARVTYYYIQASPPYDMGSGDVPLFVFVHQGADGAIGAISASPDPPWAKPAGHRAHGFGKEWELQRRLPRLSDEILTDPVQRQAWLDQAAHPAPFDDPAAYDAVEITADYKNREMASNPHPFIGVAPDGSRVILLEPTGQIMADLLALQEADEPWTELLTAGDLVIGADIDTSAPPGVQPVRVSWR